MVKMQPGYTLPLPQKMTSSSFDISINYGNKSPRHTSTDMFKDTTFCKFLDDSASFVNS